MTCERCQRVFFAGDKCPWCGKPVKGDAPTPKDSKTCKHDDFEARVDVHCLQDTATWVAEVGVRCARCHLEFSFVGLPLAISTSKACLNLDGTIVTLPIEPGPKPIPAFGIIPVDLPQVGRKES